MKFLSVDTLFSDKEEERRPEILQTLLYSFIMSEQGKATAIAPMLLFIRNVCKSDFEGNIKVKNNGGYDNVPDAMPLLPRFGKLLLAKLSDLFDVSRPFVQTDDVKACEWCPYSEICQRKS
jgi:hypothetical protein